MPCSDATRTFVEKMRARDWNAVLASGLFSERGFEELQDMIAKHGREALDQAVRGFIARSKTDRVIRRGHVRSWHFFGPYINEQAKKDTARCVE